MDTIGQLGPPLDVVSIQVLDVSDDIAKFRGDLEYRAHPVRCAALCRIGRRAPRPLPELVDVGAVGSTEVAAVEGMKVEPDGVRNCHERFGMGEVVDGDSDLHLVGVSELLVVGWE